MAEETSDVFISFSFEDTDRIDQLAEDLEKYGVTCKKAEEDYGAGRNIFDNINDLMKGAKKTLLYLTSASKDSKWCNYEAMSSIARGKQRTIPVYAYIKDEEVDQIPAALRSLHPIDSRNMEREDFLKDLVERIKAPLESLNILPTGEVAHGLVWGYFYGYLNLILPGLRERFREWARTRTPDASERNFIPKFIIILPRSCYCWNSMKDNDKRIEPAGNLPPFTKARAGKPEREYKNFLFKITLEDGKVYYFTGEYATPLMSMYELEREKMSEFNEHAKDAEYTRFCEILEQSLTLVLPKSGRKSFLLLKYDDTVKECKPLAECLADAIEEELKADRGIESDSEVVLQEEELHFTRGGATKYHAFFWHCESPSNQADIADMETVVNDLEGKEFKILFPIRDFQPGTMRHFIENAVSLSRKVILYITGEFLNDDPTNYFVMEYLHDAIRSDCQAPIPVIAGVHAQNVPYYLRTVAYIKKDLYSQETFIERMAKAIEGDIPIASAYPVSDIATGMAWSYYFGYLKLILPGMKERILEGSQKGTQGMPNERLVPKLVLLLPQSCYVYDTLQDNDDRVEYVDKVTFRLSRGGLTGRDYSSRLYKIQAESDEKEYIFAAEYAMPLYHMYEMEKGRVAGLDEQKKLEQQQSFCQILADILSNADDCKDNYILLPYEDQPTGASDKFPISKEIEKKFMEMNIIKKGIEFE